MKTAIITCLLLLTAGIASAQDHPSRKSAQHVKAGQATDKKADDAPAPAPAPQPANRSINEKGLSAPVNSSAPKKQSTTINPPEKKEEKVQVKPQ